MRSRLSLSMLLATLMLTSGCLGLFGGDETVSTTENEAPSIDVYPYSDVNQGLALTVFGKVTDESASTSTVTLAIGGEGWVQEATADVATTGLWSAQISDLPPGVHTFTVTATDQHGESAQWQGEVTVIAITEDPVAITALPATVWVIDEEPVTVALMFVHSYLDSCIV